MTSTPAVRATGRPDDPAFAALLPAWRATPGDPGLRAALTELAQDGHPAAACALAHLAFEGIGAPANPGAAFLWALRGAHGGFAAAAAMAGDFYLHSEPEHRTCVRLVGRALPWHELAARAGHARAAFATSDSYRMGRGCERDFQRAYCFLLVGIRCAERVPAIVDVLLPSLRSDLIEARSDAIEAEVAAILEGLPRIDADLDRYWSSLATAV
ncbi:MAG TPA: hypothetical protein VLA56_13920 [Pseudomonadales bacterium]|nr:hypothetical protein [Pseudomonadales bacterium]